MTHRPYRRVLCAALLAVLAIFILANQSSGKRATTPVGTKTPTASGVIRAVRPHAAVAERGVVSFQEASARSWRIRWGDHTGLPRTLGGGRWKASAANPTDAAILCIRDNAPLFGLGGQSATADIGLDPVREQMLPGATKVSFQQRVGGVPVLDATVGVIVDADNQVIHIASSARELPPINTTPGLSVTTATNHAIAPFEKLATATGDSRLVIYPSDPPKLAYEIGLRVTADYPEPWRVVVDANDGTILRQRRMVLESGATHVFNPNPVTTLVDESLLDFNNADSAVSLAAYYDVDLENLDPPVEGLYSLRGAHVWLMNLDIPTNIPPTSPDGVFSFHRSERGFEEVMAYYTIDRSQSYIQSLGFSAVNNRPQVVDAHGLFNFDVSAYFAEPVGTGTIQYGDGGVDDAEDADIILHEYGHAIHDNSAPGVYLGDADNGYGNETGAMSEGFADYWAASSGYDSSVARGFPPEYIGEWDSKGYDGGPQDYLRVVSGQKQYPGDMIDNKYADCQIWSALLWDIFGDLGRHTTDAIVLYSHFLVPPEPDFADGAQALIDADAILHPVNLEPDDPIVGAFYNSICGHASARGILTCYEICACPDHGNPQGGVGVDALDVAFVIDEAFAQGPHAPKDPFCPHTNRSDLNCDGEINILDISYVVDYVYKGGQAPCDPCAL
jgi:hypothetical protein